MGALVAATVAAVAVAGTAVGQPAVGGARLTLSPSRGTGSTHFGLTFTAPTATGTSGGSIRTITVRATGSNRAPHACTNGIDQSLSIARAGLVRVALLPGLSGAHWCTGRFSGSVQEEIRPYCTVGHACPQVIAIETIGTFAFTVVARA